jgi:plastocyanin
MKWKSNRAAAAVAALLVAACSEGGTTPRPTTGTLVGRVSASGAPVQGARITLAGSEPKVTGTDGEVRFEGVQHGSHTLRLDKLPPEYVQGSETSPEKLFTLEGGRTTAVTWTVKAETPAAIVRGERFSFSPAAVTIRAGESVRFVYAAGSPHTVTPENPSGFWIERQLASTADDFAVAFHVPGTYRYLCRPHASGFAPGQGMNGVIVVE